MKIKFIFLGALLNFTLPAANAASPEDFYNLYLRSPTKCKVQYSDKAAKVVLDGFDKWYYSSSLSDQDRKIAYRDGSEAAKYLKKEGCKDPLMLFRWGTFARVQSNENLQREAWNTILAVLPGLEMHYGPVLDNAYNTLVKMSFKFDPSRTEELYMMAIKTSRISDRRSPMLNYANYLITQGNLKRAREEIEKFEKFAELYGINKYATDLYRKIDYYLSQNGY